MKAVLAIAAAGLMVGFAAAMLWAAAMLVREGFAALFERLW